MKKYFIVLIGISILFTGCSMFNSDDSLSPKAKRALRNGNIYYAQQLLDKAEEFLLEVVEEYPDHLEANKKLADIKYFEAENDDRIAYESYLEAYEMYMLVYNDLEDVDRSDMDRDERRWFKDTKNKLESINSRILVMANKEYEAYIDSEEGDLDNIKAKYYKLISLNPDNIEPYRFLASIVNNEKIALTRSEEPDQAQISELDNDLTHLFSQWVRLAPTNQEYREQYARQLYSTEEYEQASEQIQTLIDQDPYNYEYYDLYAVNKEQTDDFEAAFNIMVQANQMIPKNVNILKSIVYYAAKLSNDDAYYQYSKQLVELEASPSNLSTFCQFLYRKEMFDDLLTYSERWFIVDKTNRVPAQFAAFAAQKLKNTNKYQYYAKRYQELANN